MFSILKNMQPGVYRSLKYREYAAHNLSALTYRFNQRFDLRGLLSRLIDVARCTPVKESVVRQHAELIKSSSQPISATLHLSNARRHFYKTVDGLLHAPREDTLRG